MLCGAVVLLCPAIARAGTAAPVSTIAIRPDLRQPFITVTFQLESVSIDAETAPAHPP